MIERGPWATTGSLALTLAPWTKKRTMDQEADEEREAVRSTNRARKVASSWCAWEGANRATEAKSFDGGEVLASTAVPS
jgi:hypothetical protein